MDSTGPGGEIAAGGREEATGARGGGDLGAPGQVATLGAMAGAVAQAIAAPLSSMMSSFRLLTAELDRSSADPAQLAASVAGLRQAAADAARGADRLGEVVRGLQLLALAGTARAREAVDVRAELAAAVELCRAAVSQRARLTLELAEGLPRVTAAAGEVGLAFTAILLDLAETLPEGGAAQRSVRATARQAGGRVVVEVAADGGASGAGLALARATMAAAGGTAEAASVPGRGPTITLSLPAAAPAAAVPAPAAEPPRAAAAPAAAPAPRPPPATGPRGRVLVVDDDPLVGRSMARLLQGAHDVTVLTSPAEAVSRIERGERWDVVLCDLMMPELSGMDVEERVARVAPDLVPRIVYLTGGAFTDKARAFLGGGRPYLEKPVEAPTLRARVAEQLKRTRGEG